MSERVEEIRRRFEDDPSSDNVFDASDIAILLTALAQAERTLEDEIVKLRADVVWIAQQRDENEQWARDRAAVAIQMADERDAARAEVERLKEEVNEQAAKHADCCVDRQDLQQAEARATALEAENERLREDITKHKDDRSYWAARCHEVILHSRALEAALRDLLSYTFETTVPPTIIDNARAALARHTPAPEGKKG